MKFKPGDTIINGKGTILKVIRIIEHDVPNVTLYRFSETETRDMNTDFIDNQFRLYTKLERALG